MTIHSCVVMPHLKDSLSTMDSGKYGYHGYHGETPLFYYILKEAEVRNDGHQLGDVGGRIVVEVLLGLLDSDPTSSRNAETGWMPVLPGAREGDFKMADLLNFAGVV